MRKKHILLLNLVIAVFFAIIFYGNYIGINLFLFELVTVPLMLYINRPVKYNLLTVMLLGSVIITALMVILINSSWSIFINFICLFTLSTALSYNGFRSFIHVFFEAIVRLISSQVSIFNNWEEPKKENGSKINFDFRKFTFLILIPLVILILFIILYASASSVFYQKFEGVFNVIFRFFENINIIFILLVILGLVIGNVLFMKTNSVGIYKNDITANNNLLRIRHKNTGSFKITGLKLQNLSGIVILGLLNILILFFNILDISHFWFGFEWDGSFLREFVHEGTWVLVFSIFLSAAIALYFFKGNLNFYSKNNTLKYLTILWIIQNFIMTISVIIRNYWYINFFGLAYKRIAVLFFLLLTLIGLVTIIIKITHKKSSFFLWKTNSFALLLVLVVTTCINWDLHIAKFNFNNYNRSFLDYRFLAKLNNSSLPYTLKSLEELEEINKVQENIMPFDVNQGNLWDIYRYHAEIEAKKDRFLKRFSPNNFMEWNYADYSAYKKLTESIE